MQIIPTVLENNPRDVINQIIRLSPYFHTFQIDVVDGVFAPNKTPSAYELVSVFINNQQLTTNGVYDFHLMTKDFENEISAIAQLTNKVKIRNIMIHIALSPNYYLLSKTFPQFTFGPVLSSEDNVYEAMKDYNINSFRFLQFMTVHIGAQGNPFIDIVLKKIEQLKKGGFTGEIYLDGGVNEKTILTILSKKYRPDVLCVGSYVTKTDHLQENIRFLTEQIAQAGLDA